MLVTKVTFDKSGIENCSAPLNKQCPNIVAAYNPRNDVLCYAMELPETDVYDSSRTIVKKDPSIAAVATTVCGFSVVFGGLFFARIIF